MISVLARWSVVVVCLGTVIAGNDAHATATPTWPAALTPADRELIERVACRQVADVGAGSLKAYRVQPGQRAPIHVDVICQARGALYGQPIKSGAACNNTGGSWKCGERAEYLEITGRSRATLLRLTSPDNAALGLGAVRYLLTLGTYKWRSVRDLVEGEVCDLRIGHTGELIMQCGSGQFWLARDCTGSARCSYRLFDMQVLMP